MYCDLEDFGKYKSEFYLKGLKGEAREATIKSMDGLRDFCMSEDCCRRGSIMAFFGEEPSFGKWCGTCDICSYREVHGDFERDFAFDGARVLLGAVILCNGQVSFDIVHCCILLLSPNGF
jgi:ATP-dependent DNA helicase RecQ/Werner syndrome ATP-dependent helicase